MPLESATFVSQFTPTNPLVGDDVGQGDDHIRLMKAVLQATLPNASKAFYFPTSPAEQAGDVTVTAADASKIYPVSASALARTVNLPASPPDGFEVTIVKTDSSANLVTIDPAGATLINGVATKALTFQYESIRCIYLSTFAAWLGLRSAQGTPFDLSQVLPIANGGSGQDTAAEAFDAFSTARADVASAGTVDLDTNNSSYARITGTTTITAITLASGRKRWVVFGGALTLTHGANLILPSSANIVTVAGDTALFVGEAAGVVRCLWYNRATGLSVDLSPITPARNYAEYTDSVDLSSIPMDDTIPQNTEGTEVLSAAITLKRSNSRVRVLFTSFGGATASIGLTAALFIDGGADAVQASFGAVSGNDRPYPLTLDYEYAPGSVGPFTYKIRVGPGTGGTGRLNGFFNGRRFGGAARATLVVEEIFV